jgi:DNA-binding transcriptional regulator YdaS (Cro superfamily)
MSENAGMENLDRAITLAGGVSALARELGITNPNAISNWRGRGRVPHAWSIVIDHWLAANSHKHKQLAKAVA